MTAPGSRIPPWLAQAKAVFDKAMPHANQVARKRPDVQVTSSTCCRCRQAQDRGRPAPERRRRHRHLELAARPGQRALFNLMEDTPPPKSRGVQAWQWLNTA